MKALWITFKESEITRLKKEALNKLNFTFRSHGIVVTTEGTKQNQVDFISYIQIRALQEMGTNAFFLKTLKNGYAFFFKGQPMEAIRPEFLETVKTLQEYGSKAQETVRKIDISPQFAPFQLESRYAYYQIDWQKLSEEESKKTKK